MTARLFRAAMLCAGLLAAASPAGAQAPPPFLRTHGIEIDFGGLWLGGIDFGGAGATLTRNQTPQAPYTLFETASRMTPVVGLETRLGFHLTRVLSVEAGLTYARPTLETTVSGDTEGAPPVDARETLSHFVIDVSGVLHLPRFRVGRAVPFVLGGAGYLRELHQDNVLVETGRQYHVGGGLKLPLVLRRGFIKSLGLRLEGRACFRTGGVDLDEDEPVRPTGAGGASLIVEF